MCPWAAGDQEAPARSSGRPGCPRLVPSKPEDGGEAGQSPDAPWEPSAAGWSPGWGRVGQTPHPPAGGGGQRPPGLSGNRARGQEPPAPPSVTLPCGALKPPSVPPLSPGGVSLVWAVVRPARVLAWDCLPRALSCLKGAGAAPCVPVLVPDLLLHLRVRQGLQQRAPLIGVTRVPDGDLHRGQGVLTVEDRRGRRFTERLQERPQKAVSTPAAGRQDVESGFCAQLPTQGTLPTRHLRVCVWGGVHGTVLWTQPFPVDLRGGEGPFAPLSVQKKGEQRSSSTQEWSPRAPALTSPQGAPWPTSQGPRTHKP